VGYMWTSFGCAQAIHWAPQLIHRKSTGFVHSLGITSSDPMSLFVVRAVTWRERPQRRPQMLSTGCGPGVCTTQSGSNAWWEVVSPAVGGVLLTGSGMQAVIASWAWGLQNSSPHFCPQGYPQAGSGLFPGLSGKVTQGREAVQAWRPGLGAVGAGLRGVHRCQHVTFAGSSSGVNPGWADRPAGGGTPWGDSGGPRLGWCRTTVRSTSRWPPGAAAASRGGGVLSRRPASRFGSRQPDRPVGCGLAVRHALSGVRTESCPRRVGGEADPDDFVVDVAGRNAVEQAGAFGDRVAAS